MKRYDIYLPFLSTQLLMGAINKFPSQNPIFLILWSSQRWEHTVSLSLSQFLLLCFFTLPPSLTFFIILFLSYSLSLTLTLFLSPPPSIPSVINLTLSPSLSSLSLSLAMHSFSLLSFPFSHAPFFSVSFLCNIFFWNSPLSEWFLSLYISLVMLI